MQTKHYYINQNSTYVFGFSAEDEDGVLSLTAGTTGYTFSGGMSKARTSSKKFPFPSINISSTGPTGFIFVAIGATLSNSMKDGKYLYDVHVTFPDGVTTKRLSDGLIYIDPKVS